MANHSSDNSGPGCGIVEASRKRESVPRPLPSISDREYETMLHMARALHWRCPSWTLNPTALVHEALIKVHGWPDLPPSDDPLFMALVARAMRQLLVDAVRKKLMVKHGFGLRFVQLTERAGKTSLSPVEFLDLNRALDQLAVMNPRHALAIDYVTFFGHTVEEAAARLKVAPRTVQRDLRAASAWLASRVANGPAGDGPRGNGKEK